MDALMTEPEHVDWLIQIIKKKKKKKYVTTAILI